MGDFYLPPFYADLYDAATRSTEFRRKRTDEAPKGAPWAHVVPLAAGDYHRSYNLLACWVFEGEPGVVRPADERAAPGPAAAESTQTAPPALPPADPDAPVPADVAIPADACFQSERYGTILAEMPQVRARTAFLRLVIVYNAGLVPAHLWLRKAAVGPHHHDRHGTADAPPPLGLTCSQEWGFCKTREGLDNARRADEAFGYAAFHLTQQLWDQLPAEEVVPDASRPPPHYGSRGGR
jgi:hypothetical protein